MTHKVSVKEHARGLVTMGHSNGHAAEVVGVSGETIARWDREGNWRKLQELSPVTEKRLRALVRAGWSKTTIGHQLDIYPARLKRLMEERGLEFGPRSRAYALSATLKKNKWERFLTNVILKSSRRDLRERIDHGEFIY